MPPLTEGMKVRYLPQPEWGVGHLVALEEGGAKAKVLFPARQGGPVIVSTRQGALLPHQLQPGDAVQTAKGRAAVIAGEVEGGRGLRRYVLRFDDGEEDEWPESEIRAAPPRPDSLAMLREGRAGDGRNFVLRRQALLLDDERRYDALGALLASRVMVKPHQLGVVQRVLSSPTPRFVLADEVGMGKTIEAGMIFSALRLSGLAHRVLVVAPSHLTVQWLVELFHKFNQLFTLLDADRYAASLQEEPGVSPWVRFPKVIASLETLSRSDEDRTQASARDAFWDLVIFDEAHHLKADKAFEAARAIAANSWGLLLLTATPMQLDPAEYHRLLTLIDPASAPTLPQIQARLGRQEELSSAVRQLLEGESPAAAVTALAERFPADEKLRAALDRDALLAHLAETYSLSDRLIRNRRSVVGGFGRRRFHRHPVEVPEGERRIREAALDRLRSSSQVHGAALAELLRRLESSPAAFQSALRGSKTLGQLAKELALPPRDAKFQVFLQLLGQIWDAEPRAKVLVFTEARETLEMLIEQLRSERIEALAYHGDLPLVQRDRQVARFRDPDGPSVLISTEIGGEGRNFQFAHHLINYDLPWSPAIMEQRIGRLDRIGQLRTVEIHAFDPVGTLSSDVLSILSDAVGVFEETVGGLDALLEEVEPRLTELALHAPQDRADYARSLRQRVAAQRESVRRAYDPLLDLRSFDRAAVEGLLARGWERLGLEGEEKGSLEEGLWTLARDLEERLEESVTQLARKVGIGVDTDQHVDAFQCAFHLGRELTVEALPGISLAEDRVVLGTFWRDTAIEQEEIDYFATGHPLVEALFGFLRDGPFGRSAVRYLERRGAPKARGLEFLFQIHPPEPDDTAPGARVPSRQLSRFVKSWLIHVAVRQDASGTPKLDPALLEVLRQEGQSLKGAEVQAAFPGLSSFVDPAMVAATSAAQWQLASLSRSARSLIETEREQTVNRLQLSLAHQALPSAAIGAQLQMAHAYYDRLLRALAGLRLGLDSVSGFVINR